MKNPKRLHNGHLVSASRWATYAVAGAASTLATVSSAEADIHYSGTLNQSLVGRPGHPAHLTLPLDAGAMLTFTQGVFSSGHNGVAHMKIAGSGAFVAQYLLYGGVYVSNLGRGVNLSTQRFRNLCDFNSTLSQTICYGGTIGGEGGNGGSHGDFQARGTGYIGFDFDRGEGLQYGWARIKITGDPTYRFIVVDYAWGDPHESVETGQKRASDQKQVVPDQGSLGLFALGGAGLLAWRQRRRGAGQSQL